MCELTARINGKWGTAGHTPVRLIGRHLPRRTVSLLLAAANVGMWPNLVAPPVAHACEFALLQAEHTPSPGTLVYSVFAGGSTLLGRGASLINPVDTPALTATLHAALSSAGPERADRIAAAATAVRAGHSSLPWARRVQSAVVTAGAAKAPSPPPPAAPSLGLLRAASRGIAADDGHTLVLLSTAALSPLSYTSLPEAGRPPPPPSLVQLVEAVAARPRTTVCLFGVETQGGMDKAWGALPPYIQLSAESGGSVRCGGVWFAEPRGGGDGATRRLLDEAVRMLRHITERTPGSVLTVGASGGHSCATWGWGLAEAVFGGVQANAARLHLRSLLGGGLVVEVDVGAKVLLVRAVGASSARTADVAVKAAVDGAGGMPLLVVCVGGWTFDAPAMGVVGAHGDVTTAYTAGPPGSAARCEVGEGGVARLLECLTG